MRTSAYDSPRTNQPDYINVSAPAALSHKQINAWSTSLKLASVSVPIESDQYKEIKTLPLRQEFGTAKDWRVTAWQAKGDEAATGSVPAKVCFWKPEDNKNGQCTQITSALPNSETAYQYQTVKELSVAPMPHLVKLVTEFSGGGSGSLNQVSFWRYDKSSDSFENAGLVTLTEQGEYKLFNQGALKGLLITADADWQPGETHFSPHRFYIQIYKFVPEAGYVKTLGYLTHSKYPSLDDTDKIDVITHEVPKIGRLLSLK